MTIYNFSAGPAVLPQEVLLQAQAELPNWRDCGMSVMEMSHRGPEFGQILAEAEADLRELMGIPSNYKVLFLQGGAAAHFALIPMNLLGGKTSADYVNTGSWSTMAIKEAQRYCTVVEVASSADKNFSYIPAREGWKLNQDAAYVHYVANETIGGVEFNWVPEVGDVPLVCDMSSNILSRPIDVSQFGLIYAGAQKNIGPAGITLIIVREDLLGKAMPTTPKVFDYQIQANNQSMINTPPTYGIYMAGLVFKWLLGRGGLAAMETTNIAKAKLVYDAIESSSGFYHSPVTADCRSRMNIPFTLKDAALDAVFLKTSQENGLLQLKGHKSVGGMRASIYNAMPIEGVQALATFMGDFARQNG